MLNFTAKNVVNQAITHALATAHATGHCSAQPIQHDLIHWDTSNLITFADLILNYVVGVDGANWLLECLASYLPPPPVPGAPTWSHNFSKYYVGVYDARISGLASLNTLNLLHPLPDHFSLNNTLGLASCQAGAHRHIARGGAEEGRMEEVEECHPLTFSLSLRVLSHVGDGVGAAVVAGEDAQAGARDSDAASAVLDLLLAWVKSSPSDSHHSPAWPRSTGQHPEFHSKPTLLMEHTQAAESGGHATGGDEAIWLNMSFALENIETALAALVEMDYGVLSNLTLGALTSHQDCVLTAFDRVGLDQLTFSMSNASFILAYTQENITAAPAPAAAPRQSLHGGDASKGERRDRTRRVSLEKNISLNGSNFTHHILAGIDMLLDYTAKHVNASALSRLQNAPSVCAGTPPPAVLRHHDWIWVVTIVVLSSLAVLCLFIYCKRKMSAASTSQLVAQGDRESGLVSSLRGSQRSSQDSSAGLLQSSTDEPFHASYAWWTHESLLFHPKIHWSIRVAVPVVLVATVALFISAHMGIGANVEVNLEVEGHTYSLGSLFVFSLGTRCSRERPGSKEYCLNTLCKS